MPVHVGGHVVVIIVFIIDFTHLPNRVIIDHVLSMTDHVIVDHVTDHTIDYLISMTDHVIIRFTCL